MKRLLILVMLLVALTGAIASCQRSPIMGQGADITIASKDFTEQDILGELLAQQIENQTGLKVGRKPRLGFTPDFSQGVKKWGQEPARMQLPQSF